MYTRIHDKFYDLSGFDHPGGMVALSLSSSRDATELFESHHQFSDKTLISKTLKKYEITEQSCPEKITSSGVYDWDKSLHSEFTKELRETAVKVLGRNIKADSSRWFQYFYLTLLLISQFYLFVKGFWLSMLTYPLSLWVFSVNVFHDASHFAISDKHWRLNSLGMNAGFMLATPYHWYHQHTIGHHSFPNIMGKDPDLYHAPEALRHSVDIPVNTSHCFQHFLFLIIQALGIPGNYLVGGGIMSMLGFPYNQVVQLSYTRYLNGWTVPLRLLVYLVIMHLIVVLVHGYTVKGMVFMIVPEFVYTTCFTLCSQINHLVPEATSRFNSNYFIHQVITGHNVNTACNWTTLFTGGLNMQIEHHLFPSVNHGHLHKLVPHVKALCKKHNVHYPESESIFAALRKHVSHLYTMGPLAWKREWAKKHR